MSFKIPHFLRYTSLVVLSLLITACSGGGGGGNGGDGQNPGGTGPRPTSMNLRSDAGDFIGQGRNYSYSAANALITVTANGGYLDIQVRGDQEWTGNFQLPNSLTSLEVGTYSNLSRYPFHDNAIGGLSWSGEGRGCNQLTGVITIRNVVYNGSSLQEIDLSFEQYCENGTTALRGDLFWNAADTTRPPGPTSELPSGLWQPMEGAVPDTGNFVYLDSDGGDYIGGGATYLYSQSLAIINVSESDGHLSVSVNGDEQWSGDFQAMLSINQLQAGYYGDLKRYPFHNPIKGGLSWSGEGRGCNELTGWFVVDSVSFNESALETIELRFEQHCEGNSPALNGAIRWDVNDVTEIPGPEAPPAGLWEPTPGIAPETGNYVLMESEVGDYIGGGGIYLYTPLDSLIDVEVTQGRLQVAVHGDERWGGDFQPMNSIVRLEEGYYGGLQRFPFHNPARGGLNWSGEGRGCNTLDGWFVVDRVVYDNQALQEIEIRFEQNCGGNNAVLNGAIRWDAADNTEPPGPLVPVPNGLWAPPPATLPATANYMYLEGRNGNYLYTQADSTIRVEGFGNRLQVDIFGDDYWRGRFEGMSTVGGLEVGYYGNLGEFPWHNPAIGGLEWSGPSGGCSDDGWLVIDSVSFDGADLESIEIRFEQTCTGGTLRGAMRWDVNDSTAPPGPVSPAPANLWEPPAGITPATGDYIYLQSDVGDFVGQGRNYLHTPSDTQVSSFSSGANLHFETDGAAEWGAHFQAMNSLNFMEVGYYGDLREYPFHNESKGGLSWSGEGRACNTLTGWFVIDSITYEGVDLTSVELRFEQRCGGAAPALRGKMRWTE